MKNNLNLEERIQFVDGVVDLSKRNGKYDPALYDYAFRIAAVVYFTDTDTTGMDQNALSELAFSDETTKMMNETPRKYILGTLNKSCREKIEIERQQYMALFEATAKNQPFEELMKLAAEVLDGIGEQLNMKEMIKTISEENMKKPVVDNSYIIKTPEGLLDGAHPIVPTEDMVLAEGKE